MRPYSQIALELKLSIEAGLVEPVEIIAWADDTLMANKKYDDDLANISIASDIRPKNLMILLGRLVDQADEYAAMRRTMARMHDALLSDPYRAHEFTRFLESFWIKHGYNVPSDMSFIVGIEDDFQLAEQGIYGTVEEATQSLINYLSNFKKALNKANSDDAKNRAAD